MNPDLVNGFGAYGADVREIADWTDALWRRRAEQMLDVPGGCAVLTPAYASAHDHNALLVRTACDARPLAAAADAALAGLEHRRISVDTAEVADALEPGLAAQGYERSDDLVMELREPSPWRGGAEVLDLAERCQVAASEWERDQPEWQPDVWRQLGDRARTAAAACDATFLGLRDAGAVVAHADLFVRDGIAQVEEVMTAPSHQGRGLASQLVLDAVRRAREAGARRVFLVADAEDWPQQLYRRLGFVDLGRTATFTRPA